MHVRPRLRSLALLAVAALAVRLLAVWLLATDLARPTTYEHGEIAGNLLAGRGFSVRFLGVEGPTSQQAPLVPVLLAGTYALFGVDTPAALLTYQLLQCLAGAMLVVAVAWIGWSLVPERPAVGWLASGGAAMWPTQVYAATHVQAATWAALWLAWLIAVAVAPGWRGTRRGAVVCGLLGGLLLLTEPILALALPVVALVFVQAAGWCGWRTGIARGGLLAATCTVTIVPWIARNAAVHGEFVFIKSTFGYALWQGNNPVSWGTDKLPKPTVAAILRDHDGTLAGRNRAAWEARHETLYIDDVLLGPAGYARFQGLSEPERSRLLGDEAWGFMRSQPLTYLKLCALRLRYFLLFDETNPKTAHPLYRIATLLWLLLTAAGLIAARDRWHALWPTIAIGALVTLFHTLTITSARFRMPIEPLGLVCGAVALVRLAGWAPWAGRMRAGLPWLVRAN